MIFSTYDFLRRFLKPILCIILNAYCIDNSLKTRTKRIDMFLSSFRSRLVYFKIRRGIGIKMCPSVFPEHQPQRYISEFGGIPWNYPANKVSFNKSKGGRLCSSSIRLNKVPVLSPNIDLPLRKLN